MILAADHRGRYGLAFFTSMKAGLLLLLLLGSLAALGSFLPQGQPPGFYHAYYGELPGRLITILSLDHVYKNWWFLGLGAILSLNLLVCSLQRWPGSRDWRRRGSIILHLGLPIILTGAVLSAALGRHASVSIGAGDNRDLAGDGFPGLVLTVKDFKIDYYTDFTPRQYISSVTLQTAAGREIERDILVNHPLKMGDLKIYQASYGWMVQGRAVVNGKEQPFALASGSSLVIDPATDLRLVFLFIPDYDAKSGSLHPRSPLPRNPRLVAALFQDHQVQARVILAAGETGAAGGYPVTFAAYRYYTGLEIKKDPGVRVVYAGFIIVLLGFILRYLWPEKQSVGNP